MSRHRFFVSTELSHADGVVAVPLSEADAHHAVDVLRIRPGEEIVVVEPGGRARTVQVTAVETPQSLRGRIVGDAPAVPEPRITLVQGIMKGPAMDETVQHAVELGAERIVPLLTQRTVVRLDAGKAAARAARWRKIAEGAARQSQRSRLPEVDVPITIAEVLPQLADYDLAVVLWEEADAVSLSQALAAAGITPARSGSRIALVVGPEGGLSADEVTELASAGAVVASLGPAVLRAGTAALVAMTLASLALGTLEPAPGQGIS